MTQIASLLAVATVFIGLWTLFTSQGGGGRNRGYGSQKTVEKIQTQALIFFDIDHAYLFLINRISKLRL